MLLWNISTVMHRFPILDMLTSDILGMRPPEDGTPGQHTHRWELGQGPSVVGNWCVGLPPENASGRAIILQINPVPFLLRWKLEAGNWQFESAKSAFPGP